jgi:hypothetical protein
MEVINFVTPNIQRHRQKEIWRHRDAPELALYHPSTAQDVIGVPIGSNIHILLFNHVLLDSSKVKLIRYFDDGQHIIIDKVNI